MVLSCELAERFASECPKAIKQRTDADGSCILFGSREFPVQVEGIMIFDFIVTTAVGRIHLENVSFQLVNVELQEVFLSRVGSPGSDRARFGEFISGALTNSSEV